MKISCLLQLETKLPCNEYKGLVTGNSTLHTSWPKGDQKQDFWAGATTTLTLPTTPTLTPGLIKTWLRANIEEKQNRK